MQIFHQLRQKATKGDDAKTTTMYRKYYRSIPKRDPKMDSTKIKAKLLKFQVT
jgi:hypothetical protein